MKLADVQNQARLLIPRYTELFSDTQTIVSILVASGVATVTTSTAHGVVTNSQLTLTNVETRTPIDAVSKDGLVFTFGTSVPHDLTEGWPDNSTIELGGFTDGAWNTTFSLKSANNRETFQVQSAETIPTLNGNEYLLEPNRIDGINGMHSATVTGATTFTFTTTANDGTYTPVNGRVSSAPRIAVSVDIDRSLSEYTKHDTQDFWMFIVPPSVVDVSKSRSAQSDANVTVGNGEDIRGRMLDGFEIIIVVNVTEQIAAATALDVCRDELLLPMMRTFLGAYFPTGLTTSNDFKTILASHGDVEYNRAVFVYRYTYQVVMDFTDSDTVRPLDTRAFRDLNYTLKVGGDDTTNMTVLPIDLDDEPLP